MGKLLCEQCVHLCNVWHKHPDFKYLLNSFFNTLRKPVT